VFDVDVNEATIRRIVREEIERALAKDPGTKNAAIIASKGTLDWAYPPLILGTSAAAAGMDTSIFFTFYGLNIIHKDFDSRLRVSPIANPGMPSPVPMPELLNSMPGMQGMATSMMKSKFRKKNVATIRELLEVAQETGVKLIACQMTMDVFGLDENSFIPGVTFGGAAAFLSRARRAHLTLFI
jgi:peroxiredoxin family protein